jgi:hypothetical protein
LFPKLKIVMVGYIRPRTHGIKQARTDPGLIVSGLPC